MGSKTIENREKTDLYRHSTYAIIQLCEFDLGRVNCTSYTTKQVNKHSIHGYPSGAESGDGNTDVGSLSVHDVV